MTDITGKQTDSASGFTMTLSINLGTSLADKDRPAADE